LKVTSPVGSRIGPYEIVGWLGAGGMGEVYRARDARLGRDVAIKLVDASLAAEGTRVRRFEQEARAAGQLNHPNILAVYDIGSQDGIPYIVSELLEGETLRARLAAAPLSPRKAIDAARQVAEGLAAAHDKGIVHRDVKPDNLFVTADGRVKILDFGIAKLTASAEEDGGRTGLPTDTAAGTVVGTARYMSPEQIRGETVDARSDIFSLGLVLYEMLAGHPAFARDTVPETMTAILKEEAPELDAAKVPAALTRIVARCMEKTRERRFQSARDLAFGLDVLSGTHTSAAPAGITTPVRGPGFAAVIAVALIATSLLAAAAGWFAHSAPPPTPDNPLIGARFSRITDWPGTETAAEISPDGRHVAFVADRDGEFDVWTTQIGTGIFRNLTSDRPSLHVPGEILRVLGFSADGSEVWITVEPDAAGRKILLPLAGGPVRNLLGKRDAAPSWSPDGLRFAYFNNQEGDPMYVAGRAGADPRSILGGLKGHNHNPVWSADGEWIYFVHGAEPSAQMDIWRIKPDGSSAEQISHDNIALNFFGPIDARTLVYVARGPDRSGPWLWALDVPTKVSQRVVSGLDRYTYVSTSRDGRRIAATASTPIAQLWRVPILDAPAEERDAVRYEVPIERALAPRFRDGALFVLGARAAGDDGLWRVEGGQEPAQLWNGADGSLSEPAAISRDGSRAAVVIREGARRRLMIIAADGSPPRTLAPSIDIQGVAGQSAADWSPDGNAVVAAGQDSDGPGLFTIPVDGSPVRRLTSGRAESPLFSPDGTLIVYSGPFVSGQSDLMGMRPDGSAVKLPPLRVRQGGYRFMPDGHRLVYLRSIAWPDFELIDLRTGATRLLTRFTSAKRLNTFDITPDGKTIVFDRTHPNSDIVLIDLPKPGGVPPGSATR
jgi:eukaryotic-like serine/threonine-protein kinase